MYTCGVCFPCNISSAQRDQPPTESLRPLSPPPSACRGPVLRAWKRQGGSGPLRCPSREFWGTAGPRSALHPMGLPGRAENLPRWLCSEWGWRGANNNNNDNNNHLCVFELSSFLFSFISVISFDPHNHPEGREGKPPDSHWPRWKWAQEERGPAQVPQVGNGASEIPVD